MRFCSAGLLQSWTRVGRISGRGYVYGRHSEPWRHARHYTAHLPSRDRIVGKVRSFLPPLLAAAICIALAYAADVTLPLTSDKDRAIGARQVVDNALSVFGTSNNDRRRTQDLDDTKKWRLAWWQTIQNYTFSGDYFWTGKGFGVNLAESDGFVVGRENPAAPMLRSPHNVHLTILARTGVPGLALWITALFAWFAMLLSTMIAARLSGDRRWSNSYFSFNATSSQS